MQGIEGRGILIVGIVDGHANGQHEEAVCNGSDDEALKRDLGASGVLALTVGICMIITNKFLIACGL